MQNIKSIVFSKKATHRLAKITDFIYNQSRSETITLAYMARLKQYIFNILTLATTQLLDKIKIDRNFIIITDRLPLQANKNALIKALKKGIKQYLKMNGKVLRYTIHHHYCSASSSNLQIIDYIGWAINRKYEHEDSTYYEMIKQYLLEEEVMTKDRVEVHY